MSADILGWLMLLAALVGLGNFWRIASRPLPRVRNEHEGETWSLVMFGLCAIVAIGAFAIH